MTSEQFLRKYLLLNTPDVTKISALKYEELFFSFTTKKYKKALQQNTVEHLTKLAKKKAFLLFHKAAVFVPAYKSFLKKHKLNPNKIRTIEDLSHIPPVNKENYLRRYSKDQLYWHGDQRSATMLSVSSGSTGKPYYWPRSIFLEYDTAITHELFADTFFNIGKLSTLVIDSYSMGMYVAGTFTLNSFRKIAKKGYPVTVVSPGIDVHEVLQIIKDIGKNYDQVVLAGYPPFVKDIIDSGIDSGITWKQLNMKFIFGAENFSENWRSNLLELAGINKKDISLASMNTYGSADCAVLGHETPLSITIRGMIDRLGLSTKVFGINSPPTLVQYNPLQRYFEKENNHLIFTANGGIPLIRYDIKDEGRLLWLEDIRKHINLKKIKPSYLSPWKSLPFLSLSGRSGNTVTLYGLNVYPENIKSALENNKIIKLVSGKFRLATKNDRRYNQYLEITIELTTKTGGIEASARSTIKKIIIEYLKRLNFEYAKLYEKIGRRADPKIIFVPRGSFQQIDSKHRWTNR